MMNKLKRLFGNLAAGAVSIFILCLAITAPYQVEVHATAPGPAPYTVPSDGVGRVVLAETEQETSVDTPETETAEIEPYIASEPVVEETVVEVFEEADPVIRTDLDVLIIEAAERYDLPWQLVSAVCYVESNYNPYAVSSTPDYGLMQITQSVMANYGLTADNWMDPAANLDAGCRIIREKMDLSGGDITQALTRYRFGDAEALRMWGRGEYSNWYSERVLAKYYELIREG